MNRPPEYFYPLYGNWERNAYAILKKRADELEKMEVKTDQYATNLFFKSLIKSQKSKNWKPFLQVVCTQQEMGKLDVPALNEKAQRLEYKKGIDTWAVFTGDKRLCTLVDKTRNRKIQYVGTKNELAEFVIRYVLSQLLQDWRGPNMMLLVESSKSKRVKIPKLNRLLSKWDFTRRFKR
jgi:hypothetical protein